MSFNRSELGEVRTILDRMFPGTRVETECDASYMNPMLIIYYPSDTHRIALTGNTPRSLARAIAASADRYEKLLAIVTHEEVHTDTGAYDE